MVWGEIEMCEKVSTDYGLLNISDDKGKGKCLFSDCDCVTYATETWYRGAVCGREFGSVGTLSSLGREGWEN